MRSTSGFPAEVIYTVLIGSVITSLIIFGTLYWFSRSGKKRKPPGKLGRASRKDRTRGRK